MTERIRELLDEAVSGLEPAHRDPVAAVVRRGRAARRRTTALAGAMVAVLLAGGLVAGQRMFGGDPLPAANGGDAQSATPRVDGDTVVAGAMRLPIPQGWKAVVASAAAECGMMPRTILLIVTSNRGCQNAPVEVSRSLTRTPGGVVTMTTDGADIVTAPSSITLTGGEPAWLPYGLDSEEMKTGRYPEYNYSNDMLLPWSRVLVTLRMDGTRDREIIESIRTEPVGGGRLTLPDTITSAQMTIGDEHGTTPERAAAEAALRLLRRQVDTVSDKDACASPGQESARLTLDPTGSNPTTIIIALGEDCQEAVSSRGGRVRLSDATIDELKSLLAFGVR